MISRYEGMRILLAEDEKRMASALTELLKQEGYAVDHVSDGCSALALLESGFYDAALIDVMMPGMDGFTVVSKARKQGIVTRIIMLTAKDQLEDVVTGLDSGADDYLTKPFETKELLARIRALCRRNDSYQRDELCFEDLILDRETALLSCNISGQSIRLSEKEFRILEYMMTNHNRILTREQIALKIWGYDNEAEYNNVEVYLSFTRKKLLFIGSKVKIKSVRGLGYELRYGDV